MMKKNISSQKPVNEKTGRTIWDIAASAFTLKPIMSLSIILAIMVVALVLIFFNILGLEYYNSSLNIRLGKSPKPNKPDTSTILNEGVILKDTVLAFCFEQGYKYSSPIIIKSLIISCKLDLIGLKKDTLFAQERIYYTIVALRDIAENENIFVEDYSTLYASKIKRWHGTEQEKSVSGASPNQFSVIFECKKGETKTIVTGTDLYFKYPLPENRNSNFRNIMLQSNEDLWTYPNKDDVIGNLTIILESNSFKLIPFEKGAMVNVGNNSMHDKEVTRHNIQEDQGSLTNSISASWSKILPDQTFGIHYRYEK